MFCSFGEGPRIMRLFCWGEVVERGRGGVGGRWEREVRGFRGEGVEGARAVVVLRVWKVGP